MEYFSLGGVSLPWTPSALSYSAGHHIVKQDLIGGNRIWQMMGNNPGSIEVTGIRDCQEFRVWAGPVEHC
jgi:hypothetical protein